MDAPISQLQQRGMITTCRSVFISCGTLKTCSSVDGLCAFHETETSQARAACPSVPSSLHLQNNSIVVTVLFVLLARLLRLTPPLSFRSVAPLFVSLFSSVC